MSENVVSQGKKLRTLLARPGPVVPVLGIPDAATGKIMEANGVEAAFIGGALTGSRYTGMPDDGSITSTEALWIGRFIARSVSIPIVFDGDTGYGGPATIRRLVHEAIGIGMAAIRIDDQVIESFGGSEVRIVSREQAIARYKAAVAARDELDPDFVIMAQSFAREALNGDLEELLQRLPLYEQEGGADWVQFEAPRSIEEIQQARRVVQGTLTVARERLPAPLTVEQLTELGLNGAWLTSWPVSAIQAATRSIMAEYREHGPQAFIDFQAQQSPANARPQ